VNQYCNNAILSILGEEQLSDANLSTFYVFDKESAKSQLGDKVAAERACAARGCAVRATPCDIGASAMPAQDG